MDKGALLKTLLHELKDGLVVCDSKAKITLFNTAAAELFDRKKRLRKGLSLYDLCLRPPVEQALRLLEYQQNLNKKHEVLPYIQFLNKTIDQDKYMRCRVSFLDPQSGSNDFFVLVFEDISAWYTPENPMFMSIEEFRAPMTNLRAAVENLTEYPEMSPVMRSAFENVLVQETLNLTEAFNSLAGSCNVLMQTQNHLTELNAVLLFSYVAHHLRNRKIPVTSAPSNKIFVKVDTYGLLLILDYLVDKILERQPKKELSCKTHAGEKFVFLDFIWPGKLIATGSVKAWLEERLEHSLGEMTVAAILNTMEGDFWSQQHTKTKSMLRLALPIAIQSGS